MKYTRNCPECGVELGYWSKWNLIRANKEETLCRKCTNKSKKKPTKTTISDFFRNCPNCGEIIYYSTEYSLKSAIKRGGNCNSCSAKKNISKHNKHKIEKAESRPVENRKCIDCNEPISTQSIRCRSCSQRGSRGSNWQGGRWLSTKGYVMVRAENHPSSTKRNYIFEHRIVMEQHLGRYLDKNEFVHHKNGIRDDNRIENLELWDTNQPIGSRTEDLINWAIEYLNKNDYEIRKK